MARRGQGVASKARKAPTRPDTWKPLGRVPFPTLACGTAYRAGMAVVQVIDTPELELTRHGHICWVTWDEVAKVWEATVDWGGTQEQAGQRGPGSRVPLADLRAEPVA